MAFGRPATMAELRKLTDDQLRSEYNSTFRKWCGGGPEGPFNKVKKVLGERKVNAQIHLRPDE